MTTLHGILYAGKQLKYMDLTETHQTYMVNNPLLQDRGMYRVEGLTLFDKDVVFAAETYSLKGGHAAGKRIFSLFSDAEPVIRRYSTEDFTVHHGQLIDGGFEHLSISSRDSNRNSAFLISEEEMQIAGLKGFVGLGVDTENQLYAWSWKRGPSLSSGTVAQVLVNLDYIDSENYAVGKTILTYNKAGGNCTRGVILPFGRLNGEDGENYGFSALSTSSEDYLDLNGKKIEGSESGKSNWWRDVRTISLEGDSLEVLCSDYVGRQFTTMKIDLSLGRVTQRDSIEIISDARSTTINRAIPITDEEWHSRLLERGRQIKEQGVKEFSPDIPYGGRGCC